MAVLAASACSGTSSTAGPATSSSQSTAGVSYAKAEIAKYSAAPAAPTVTKVSRAASLRGKTVWYVPIGGSLPIMSVAGQAVADALGHLDATVHTCNGNFQPTTVAACLDDAANQGAAAVITAYVDYKTVPNAFNNLAGHHIPVLLAGVNKPSTGSISSDLAFLSFDTVNYKTSRLMSDAVIADSGGKASVLAIRLTDSAATIGSADQGVAELRQRCPACTVYTQDTSTAHLSTLASSVSAQLTRHPDLNYIVGLDDNVSAITAGISNAGLTGKVKIVSKEGEAAVMQRVASGNSNVADVGFSAVSYGWSFADALVRLVSGDPIGQGSALVRVFDHENTAGLTITPAKYATLSWYDTSGFEDAYLTAWGVS